jgi:hypothetical protein
MDLDTCINVVYDYSKMPQAKVSPGLFLFLCRIAINKPLIQFRTGQKRSRSIARILLQCASVPLSKLVSSILSNRNTLIPTSDPMAMDQRTSSYGFVTVTARLVPLHYSISLTERPPSGLMHNLRLDLPTPCYSQQPQARSHRVCKARGSTRTSHGVHNSRTNAAIGKHETLSMLRIHPT